MPTNSSVTTRSLARARAMLAQNPAQALMLAERLALRADRDSDWENAAHAHRISGQALRLQGRHFEALTQLNFAAQRAEQSGNPLLALQVQVGRVDSLGMVGRIAEAFAFGESLIRQFLAQNAPSEAARVCINLGILHYRRDQYREALDRYAQAANVLETEGKETDLLSRASLCFNRSNALTALGQVEDAAANLEQARTLAERAGSLPMAAAADINRGYLLYISGRYADALPLLERARQEFETLGDEEGAAQCDADLADTYRALNLAPEARECGQRAALLFARLGLDYDSARAERGQAATLSILGDLTAAEAALERAQTLFQRQDNRVQLAHLQLQWAALRHKQSEYADAITLAQRARRTFARAKLVAWAAEARSIEEQARESRDKIVSVRALSGIVRAARANGRGSLECRAALLLGREYARRGQSAKALRQYRIAVAALEQSRTLIAPEELHSAFLRDKIAVYEEIVGFLLARNRPRDTAEALEMVERAKSRLLLERVQSALSEQRSDSAARRRMATLRTQLSQAYFQDRETDNATTERRIGGEVSDRTALSLMERDYNVALRTAEQEPGDPTSLPLSEILRRRTLQAALKPDETLLEFFSCGDMICAFVLTRNSLYVDANLAKLSEVAYTARRLRFQLQRAAGTPEFQLRYAAGLFEETRQTLAELYTLLFAPLQSALPSGKLTLVPHGILHSLPFPAFVDTEGEYALERWEITLVPSAAMWHRGVQKARNCDKPRGVPLLMGVSGGKLSGVSREISRLACVLPEAKTLSGKHATRANFQTLAPDAPLIHLAAHAEFRADNPLFSGIRLADGYLLARDLYTLPLKCDLATLAACQTGTSRVEPGDELFGLLRGFLAAGAKSVAASLWAVDDAATATLMTHFYERLGQGASKAAALRAAQKATMQILPHPYHWAAFVLVGERGSASKKELSR